MKREPFKIGFDNTLSSEIFLYLGNLFRRRSLEAWAIASVEISSRLSLEWLGVCSRLKTLSLF